MKQRKKAVCLAVLLGLCMTVMQPVSAKSQSYGTTLYAAKSDLPSAPAVKLIAGGDFYMELSLTQTITEEGVSYPVTGEVIMAGKDGRLFICNTMTAMGMEMQMTQVYDGAETWEVDLASKTYAKSTQTSDAETLASMKFVKQGKATVNGKEMLYDRYETSAGEVITFFIQKGKVAVLGIESEGEVSYFSVMELRSGAPEGLMFEIPAEYKKVDKIDPLGVQDMGQQYVPDVGDLSDYMSEEELKELQGLLGEDISMEDLLNGNFDMEDLLGGDGLEDIMGGETGDLPEDIDLEDLLNGNFNPEDLLGGYDMGDVNDLHGDYDWESLIGGGY